MSMAPQLHIYLDCFKLNQTIGREPFYYKTPDDILHKLLQAKMFTIVDYSEEYYHIKLDEASSFLTTLVPLLVDLDPSGCHLSWL